MRRRLMRGLHYLTHGEDVIPDAMPIITDAVARRAAEDFNTPLSARFIYTLLIMKLLEEEGLMEHFLVARMAPGIERTADMFATESNSRVARLAMAQETWLGKLRVASRLYGKGDGNDAMVAAGLRVLHGLPGMR
ncbi:hypothetical protein V491_04395 [Pseudogymnoascus sp. VKM F-3775]|nr:hypothetical protein V491_04395 [Pseudogymnoascus sp. VKM F-3775]